MFFFENRVTSTDHSIIANELRDEERLLPNEPVNQLHSLLAVVHVYEAGVTEGVQVAPKLGVGPERVQLLGSQGFLVSLQGHLVPQRVEVKVGEEGEGC